MRINTDLVGRFQLVDLHRAYRLTILIVIIVHDTRIRPRVTTARVDLHRVVMDEVVLLIPPVRLPLDGATLVIRRDLELLDRVIAETRVHEFIKALDGRVPNHGHGGIPRATRIDDLQKVG